MFKGLKTMKLIKLKQNLQLKYKVMALSYTEVVYN